MVPAREVFRNFPAPLIAAFYLLSALAILVFCYGAWLRILKYRRGRPADRTAHLWRRLGGAAAAIGSHSTLTNRNVATGVAHFGIFWGFVALFIGTVIIMIDYDMVRLVNPAWQFWRGTFYLWYSIALDVLGAGSSPRTTSPWSRSWPRRWAGRCPPRGRSWTRGGSPRPARSASRG